MGIAPVSITDPEPANTIDVSAALITSKHPDDIAAVGSVATALDNDTPPPSPPGKCIGYHSGTIKGGPPEGELLRST